MVKSILEFVQYLKTERRYSDHTCVAYETDVNALSKFLSLNMGVKEWSECHTVAIRSWLVSLQEGGATSKTIHRKLSSVRSFFQFLCRTKVVQSNPAKGLTGPKLPKRLPSFIKEKEIKQLMSHQLYSDDWLGLRDRLLIMTLYECGIRRSELIGLTQKDVDVIKKTIKVIGKGNKERLIPIRTHWLEAYAAYESSIAEVHEGGREAIFVTKNGNRMYPKAVYNVVVKYLSLITAQEYKGPHVLRHSFATHLTNEGAEIRAIQELLGHASLAATQVYTHNSIDKLRRAYKNAHPKA